MDLSLTDWAILAAVAATCVLGCLRVIGWEYYHAVLWHNLRVECHALRKQQEQKLLEMMIAGDLTGDSAPGDPAPPDADVVGRVAPAETAEVAEAA